MSAPLLSIRKVTRRFGGLVANSDVSIDVPKGEILGLIGPNGAGKSTLFNIIAGAFPPSEGQIMLDGADITRLSAPRRCTSGIARTFQVVKSFESMSVIENVMIGAFVRTPSATLAREKAAEVLDFVELGRRNNALAGELTPPEKTPARNGPRLGDRAAASAPRRSDDGPDADRGAGRRRPHPPRAG